MTRLRRAVAGKKGDRGIALIMVLLALTLVTAVVVQFSYDAHIDYSLAANESDEVRAYYLARSGVNLYKLILTADQKIASNNELKQLMAAAGMGGFELWRMVPMIDSAMLRSAADPEMPDEMKEQMKERFGGIPFDTLGKEGGFLDFQGDIHAEIEDEERKINLNNIADDRLEAPLDSPIGRAIFGFVADTKWDPMFDGYNALGERKVSREEMIGNLIDWVDPNQEAVSSGGTEDNLYTGYEERYTAKNAKFDTLGEVAMVRGVDDDFLAAFGKRITVFSNGKININTADAEIIAALILAYSEVPLTTDQALETAKKLIEFRDLQPFSKPEEFIQFLKDSFGITFPAQGAAGIRNRLDIQSRVFTIRSTGYAGEARVTITAVVDNTGTSFRWLYWRVD
jgi:general secretion pathway protein K